MTPHQFGPWSEAADTVLVRSHTPYPLDVAVPMAAASWIASRLSERVADVFQGRMLFFDAGFAPVVWGGADLFAALWADQGWTCRYGVWITDRVLTNDVHTVRAQDGTWWLAFDWWQWMRRHLPSDRWPDAWFYLCLACPEYRASPEQRALGLAPGVEAAMAREGERLFDAMVRAVAARVEALWAGGPP